MLYRSPSPAQPWGHNFGNGIWGPRYVLRGVSGTLNSISRTKEGRHALRSPGGVISEMEFDVPDMYCGTSRGP